MTTPADLAPGDRIEYAGVTCTILAAGEPSKDRFGQSMVKLLARREDTRAEGYLIFGPAAGVARLPDPPASAGA